MCGGLIMADAEWCGQCGARFDRKPEVSSVPEEPSVRAATRSGSVRRLGEKVVWTCPACGAENPLDEASCGNCGTPFRALFEEGAGRAPGRASSTGRITWLSLVLPGAGHVAAGRLGEGVARAVMFLWVLGSGIAMLVYGEAPRSFTVLALVYLLAAAIVYGGTALDASRAAGAQKPLLSGRALLYLAGGLILLTIIVVLISGIRIAR